MKNSADPINNKEASALDVDAMLGRTAKWLRIIGFDAEYPVLEPRAGRIFVTTRFIKGCPVARIRQRDVSDQLDELLKFLGVDVDFNQICSRCLLCNQKVAPIDPIEIVGLVPPLVLRSSQEFHFCKSCNKIYWPGSHVRRIISRLKRFHQHRVVD